MAQTARKTGDNYGTTKSPTAKKLKATAFALFASIGFAACAPQTGAINTASDNNGIIGGLDATGNEDFAQTIVSVYNTETSGLCTGSIVSDSLLVTAAHCVTGPAQKLALIFGKNIKDTNNRVVKRVDAYKVSPLWPFRQDESLNSGDIAMVKFSGGLPPGYRPAQVLSNKAALTNGAVVLLAGYGISDGVKHTGSGTLRSAEVKILNAAYSESELLVAQNEGKGACHGDSGGPAYVRINGQLMLWGVTNRGVNDPNNDCSVSAAYASIPYYRDWLKQTASELTTRQMVDDRVAASF